jgi:SM-20-related protein
MTMGSPPMLNPALDLPACTSEFARTGRIRIRDVLPPDLAEAIAAELAGLPYRLFCATRAGVAVLDVREIARWPAERQEELRTFLMEGASQGVGFSYGGVKLTEAWATGAPATPLGRLHDWMNSASALDLVRALTGPSDIDGTSQQATRYMPGHYLTRHLDDPANESRRFAFVWGFSKPWLPDWGGLLQFFSPEGEPTDSLSPGFNTLDLFHVRHWHSVTYVAPFARAPRLAISGWFIRTPKRT